MLHPHLFYFSKNNKVELLIHEKKLVLNVPMKKFQKGLHNYNQGKVIQRAFPFLTADEREFMITGLLPEEWDAMWMEEYEI